MSFADTSVKFTVDDSTLLVGLTGIQKAVEGVAAKMATMSANANIEKQSSLLDTLKSNWVAFSAAAVGAWMTVGKAMELVELGAKAEQAAESFKIVADSSGIASDALLANLQRAAAGTVADSDLMQSAVRGMVLGLSDDQLVKIMENARIAARYAGTDVQTAFEGISNAIGTDLPRALKQYGAITREETKLLEEGFTGATRQTELFAIAMANLDVKTAKFGVAAANASERVQTFWARMKEAKETGGEWMVSAMSRVLAVSAGIQADLHRWSALEKERQGDKAGAQEQMDLANDLEKQRREFLGIKTEDEKKADAAANAIARANLSRAEKAKTAEDEKLKTAAHAKTTAEALAKYDEDEAKKEDVQQKASFEAELQRQEMARKAQEETFNARKILGQTSIVDEIAEYNRRANLLPSGSPEQIKAQSDVAKATMEMTDRIFEHEKTLGMQSLQDEINFQKQKAAAAVAGSTARMTAEEAVYKKEQELRDKSNSAALGLIGQAAERLKAQGFVNASSGLVEHELGVMASEQRRASGLTGAWARGSSIMNLDDVIAGFRATAELNKASREGLGSVADIFRQGAERDPSRSSALQSPGPTMGPDVTTQGFASLGSFAEPGFDAATLKSNLDKVVGMFQESGSKIKAAVFGNVEQWFVDKLMSQVERN